MKDYSCPKEKLLGLLKDLCADTKNHVFVVSGKERHSLLKTLYNIPRLGLAAEHGMFISWPSNTVRAKRVWETTTQDTDDSWRNIAKAIMEVYTSRTHGSYIEETEMKLLWQYRDADPEFGYLQSRELEDHLSNVLRSYQVDVLHGGVDVGGGYTGYVEVRPKGVNKGVLSTVVLQKLEKYSNARIDFMMAIGDDHCDEPMLSVVRQIGRRVKEARRLRDNEQAPPPLPATITPVDVSSVDEFVSSSLSCFTATVGKKPSAAANYINDVDEVHELLEALTKVAMREHAYYSSMDLRSMSGNNFNQFNTGTEFSVPEKFVTAGYNETISAGITRSLSMGIMSHSGSGSALQEVREVKISANLGQYLNELHDDEEDEDGMFF